jgi:esterase/lipase superfamily enzyme
VNRLIGLSGIYDIRRWADGHYDDNVYFNNPPDYLANERDPGRLAAMRRQDIILVTGEDDSHRHQNEQLSSLLWSKGVGNALRLWDGWSHDWPYWQKMIRHYIGGSD